MTDPALSLVPGEVLITAAGELLWRQVTEHTWNEVEGIPASVAFQPASIDKDMASYSRESKITAQDARDWHTKNAKSPSLGVWALAVGEVQEELLNSIDDSATPLTQGQVRAPGHCYVDFRQVTKRDRQRIRVLLLDKALKRQEIPTTP